MVVSLPPDAPAPRLCQIIKSSPDQEYGYNLHAEKGRPQFIGTVDAGSPADVAGLKPGDLIFAVNGHSIVGESHKQVVNRIREDPLKCELLVITESGAEWYREHNIAVSLSLPNVVHPSKEKGDLDLRKENAENASPTPAAHWYAPKEQDKPVFTAPPPPAMAENGGFSGPRPRLSILQKSDPSVEFGFNLHAEKNRGHFVGAVDKGGIGELAGLEMGQRIVGVNGTLIYPHTEHKEVVSLIRMNPLRTELLIASEEVDRWYKENHAEFSFSGADVFNPSAKASRNGRGSEGSKSIEKEDTSSMPHVLESVDNERNETPVGELSRQPQIGDYNAEGANESEDILQQVYAGLPPPSVTLPQDTLVAEPEPDYGIEEQPRGGSLHDDEHIEDLRKTDDMTPPSYPQHGESSAPEVTESIAAVRSAHNEPVQKNSSYDERDSKNGGFANSDIFSLSAEEARNRLTHRKKDPRLEGKMTIEEKYRLISNM